jgi:hypothetical protein
VARLRSIVLPALVDCCPALEDSGLPEQIQTAPAAWRDGMDSRVDCVGPENIHNMKHKLALAAAVYSDRLPMAVTGNSYV